jgi:hypothetical protein
MVPKPNHGTPQGPSANPVYGTKTKSRDSAAAPRHAKKPRNRPQVRRGAVEARRLCFSKKNEQGAIYGRLRGHCHWGARRAQGRELSMLAKNGEQHSEVTTALALACVMPLWPAMRGLWSAGRHRPLTRLQRDLWKDIASKKESHRMDVLGSSCLNHEPKRYIALHMVRQYWAHVVLGPLVIFWPAFRPKSILGSPGQSMHATWHGDLHLPSAAAYLPVSPAALWPSNRCIRQQMQPEAFDRGSLLVSPSTSKERAQNAVAVSLV